MNKAIKGTSIGDQAYIPAQDLNGGRVLPIYKGYTVDFRLKEFRKIDERGLLISHPFWGQIGDGLLCEMIEQDLVPQKTLSELF